MSMKKIIKSFAEYAGRSIPTILAGIAVCSFSAFGASRFEIVESILPEKTAPGKKVAVNLKVKPLELDDPNYFRPEGYIEINSNGKVLKSNAENAVPWKVEELKVNEPFNVTINFTISPEAKPGDDITLNFGIWRQLDGKYIFTETNGAKWGKVTFKCGAKEELKLNEAPVFPQIVVPKIKAPSIDDVYNAEEWAKAVETTAFVASIDGKAYSPKSKVRMGYDDTNLYILTIAEENDGYEEAKNIFKIRDASVWDNDSIDMIFQPDLKDNDYFQFICDTLGQKYDAYNTDCAGYNPIWQSKATKQNNTTYYEVAIPISAISNKGVQSGTIWRADFFRYREKGTSYSGWSSTFGSHDQIKNYGYLVFGSAKDAIIAKTAFADDVRGKLKEEATGELKQILDRTYAIRNKINAGTEEDAAKACQPLMHELNKLSSDASKQLFTIIYKTSGAAAIVQQAPPYSIQPPTESSSEIISEFKASFMADEMRDFAFNITNISKDTLNLRFSLRYGEKTGTDNATDDFFRLGLPGFKVTWRNNIPIATRDGSLSYDSLPETPGGIYVVPAGQTIQAFLSLQADSPKPVTKGFMVIEAVDGKDFKTMEIPVLLETSPVKLSDAPEQPLSFGFDYLPNEICDERPDFAKKHFHALREYGYNTCMISSLRYLPRPKADKDGNIIEEMDFSRFEKIISLLSTEFDAYYLNVDIMEKQNQRMDLFGLKVDDPAFEKAYKAWIIKIIEKCEELGLTSDKLVVCPYDESVNYIALNVARWTKEASPKTRIIIDCSSDNLDEIRALDKYTDIWMPHLRTLNQEGYKPFYDYLLENNRIIMTYYYSGSNNEKMKSPYSDYALNFWICFNRNLRGMAYWAAGQYYGDPWYRKSFKGYYDTALLYLTENGVIPSRRLLGWKRGFQDFQLLKLAEQKLKANGNADELKRLHDNVQLVIDYPNQPQNADMVRDYCRSLLK